MAYLVRFPLPFLLFGRALERSIASWAVGLIDASPVWAAKAPLLRPLLRANSAHAFAEPCLLLLADAPGAQAAFLVKLRTFLVKQVFLAKLRGNLQIRLEALRRQQPRWPVLTIVRIFCVEYSSIFRIVGNKSQTIRKSIEKTTAVSVN